ncbi:MAG: Na+:solute symporter [Flavobacteriaceae bacterium]|jgi:solute:Na+ symporter, SSS family|nr:Na+:solute symporter [Flavobacteriaceae bacterium]MDO7599151.1 Na+:solute symporter [Flavobacteriaceae bacterium]MDO7603655.1 Na+:solute symporter [Flavobacteriaceae bacterium]MDO7703324.1 Na+:solute symporter [Flavobacteriaceae bacterium]
MESTMTLSTLDWGIIILFFVLTLVIGLLVSRKAGTSSTEFFLSGRNMPWWLLGISMVATTFSADTPNLVTDIVRKNGVSGNWVWWAFLLTGMLTVFVYAKLWRKSGVVTDLEFYELRYSGKGAAFLRGFRALYLGVFFNIMIMASVCLAAIKIGSVLLGFTAVETLIIASTITVLYSSLGGLKGVVITDFFQFILAMGATFWATYYIIDLPQIGSLDALLTHPNVIPKLDFIPDFQQREVFITLFILPIAIQWWSVWYPGAEPGGGGYIAQRMLSAKDEKNAVWATLLFNFAHYALRPWPWILIALASLIIFPDLQSLQAAFPDIDPSIVKDDLAYPAMMTFLPAGLIGLIVASLIAAFMSTISSHLNWGSSYVVYDFYQRFVKPEASEKELVRVGRWSTLILMIASALFALLLSNALEAFQILLQIGAGTGLLFIMRWFWYRINAYSEITAMTVSFVLALYFKLIHTKLGFDPIADDIQLVLGVAITTLSWVVVTLVTSPSDKKTLNEFYKITQPGGPGWNKVVAEAEADGVDLITEKRAWNVPTGILCMVVGSVGIYGALFSTGYFIYGEYKEGSILLAVTLLSFIILRKLMKKLMFTD